MDPASSGVWDSPMATDYWVKRFGFMWAGGRSGMHGLKALQVSLYSFILKKWRSLCNFLHCTALSEDRHCRPQKCRKFRFLDQLGIMLRRLRLESITYSVLFYLTS